MIIRLHWTVERFNQTKNPHNCSLLRLDRCADNRVAKSIQNHGEESEEEYMGNDEVCDDRHLSLIYKLSEESYKILCLKRDDDPCPSRSVRSHR